MAEQLQGSNDVSFVYKYPKHFLYVEALLFSLISTLLIFAWIPALMSLFTYGNVLASALRAAVFLNITAIALVLLSLFVKTELRTTVFILTDRYLAHKTSMGVKQIALSDIQGLSFVNFPLSGGVMVVEGGRRVMNVPLFLQNSRDLIDRLEALCREKAVAFSPNDAVMQTIRSTSELSAMVYRRSSGVFRTIVSLCIAMLPVNVFIGVFYWDMSIIPLAGWAVIGPFFPITGYAIADIIIRCHEKAALKSGSMSNVHSFEDTVVARSALTMICCYCIVAIVCKALVL